jgi:hypothetical protein
MSKRNDAKVRDDNRPRRSVRERPMQVDYFAVLSVVIATLLILSQGFVLAWLDLL